MTESEKLVEMFSDTCVRLNSNKRQVAETLYKQNTKKIKLRKQSFINQSLGMVRLSYDVGLVIYDYVVNQIALEAQTKKGFNEEAETIQQKTRQWLLK